VRELVKVWADQYLAGLWKSCFIYHLEWKRDALGVEKSLNPIRPHHVLGHEPKVQFPYRT
jgi:hypothetical protein